MTMYRLVALSCTALCAACGPATQSVDPDVSPNDPDAATPVSAAIARTDTVRRGHVADVRFAQQMISHHGQALEMVALIPERASRADLRLLGERIEVSQRDEIASMQRWLRRRGEDAPDPLAHSGHAAGDHSMPGMLTRTEMTALASASGAEFDRLFLESMIRHHEGALQMVAALFSSAGGGQEPEIFGIASEVDADQRAEIERMRAMVRGAPGGGGAR